MQSDPESEECEFLRASQTPLSAFERIEDGKDDGPLLQLDKIITSPCKSSQLRTMLRSKDSPVTEPLLSWSPPLSNRGRSETPEKQAQAPKQNWACPGISCAQLAEMLHENKRHAQNNAIPIRQGLFIEKSAGRWDDEWPHRIDLIDCRWDYEFMGGSIISAVNICDGDCLKQHMITRQTDEDMQVVFYCQYSQVRAVNISSYFQKLCFYNWLSFSDVNILVGGFNEFYRQYGDLTTGDYIPEHHEGREIDKELYLMNCDPMQLGLNALL